MDTEKHSLLSPEKRRKTRSHNIRYTIKVRASISRVRMKRSKFGFLGVGQLGLAYIEIRADGTRKSI